MLAKAFALVLVAVLIQTSLAQELAALGEPCFPSSGADAILCAQPADGESFIGCRKDDGTAPLFGREFGRCFNLLGLFADCSGELDRCGIQSINLALDNPGLTSGFPLVCEDNQCVYAAYGELANSCDPRVLAGGGLPCRDAPDCDTGEGPLYCEKVSGFPSTVWACVSRDIPVGGSCPTGIASPVNFKVYKKCVFGASCVGGGRFSPGTCTKD